LNSNKPILLALGFVVATGVIGSVLSPSNVIQILGFCGIVTVSLVGLVKQNDTADRVAEVKVDLARTSETQGVQLEKIAETSEKTHTLVNSNMGIQLKLGMELSEFKAVTTGKSEDIQASKLARTMYEEHVKKQAVVDGKAAA
jgi:hypothetical protein